LGLSYGNGTSLDFPKVIGFPELHIIKGNEAVLKLNPFIQQQS